MNTLEYITEKLESEQTVLPWQIPNSSRLDLLKWIRELDFKTMVEVGVAHGIYGGLAYVLNPQIVQYGVDPYVPYSGYSDYKSEEKFSRMKLDMLEMTGQARRHGKYHFLEKTSMEALKEFEDNSIDFVYIDGNHQLPYIYDDVSGWYEKVKPGGILAGHDFTNMKRVGWGVKETIHKFTKERNIDPWFVIGLENSQTVGYVREKTRSWMIVK